MADFSSSLSRYFYPATDHPLSSVSVLFFLCAIAQKTVEWQEAIFDLLLDSLSEVCGVWTGVHPSRVLH